MNINLDYNIIEDAIVVVKIENEILRNIALRQNFQNEHIKKTFLIKIQNFRLNKTSFALLMIEINKLKILSLSIKSTINDQIN